MAVRAHGRTHTANTRLAKAGAAAVPPPNVQGNDRFIPFVARAAFDDFRDLPLDLAPGADTYCHSIAASTTWENVRHT